MICACSALLVVYLRGPNTAPLDTGFFLSSCSDMDVLDFVEQNVWGVPPRSTMTGFVHICQNVQFTIRDDGGGVAELALALEKQVLGAVSL